MPLSTSVKYISSTAPGAPVLSAAAGSLSSILDACLVDGFGLVSVTSVVVTSGVALANVSSHSFEKYAVALMIGSTVPALNGEKRVLSVAPTTFTFDATGVANGTYSAGPITAKIAPLGWITHRTSTNKRMFKSPNVLSNGIKLRIDDTNTHLYWNASLNTAGTLRAQALVSIAYDDTTIDAYTGTDTYWPKQNSSTATTARPWVIIGDDRGFFFYSMVNSVTSSGTCYYFGEFTNPTLTNDNFATLIMGYNQSAGVVGNTAGSTPGNSAKSVGSSLYSMGVHGYTNVMLARSYSQLGGAVASVVYGSGLSAYSGLGGLPFPNPADFGLYFCDKLQIVEGALACMRGTLPGFNQVLHTRPLGNLVLADNVPSAPGRVYLAIQGQATPLDSTTQIGEAMLDIVGPWR